VALTSEGPANRFGLGTKGRLAVGADADMAIVDLDRVHEIRDEEVLSKIGWTPYAGRTVRGAVDTTIVRGRVVYRDGHVVGEAGWGNQATPSPAPIATAPESIGGGT
jgi:dihydroorotase